MSDIKYTKTHVDGQLGPTMSVGASADWSVNVIYYDRDGDRMDTTSQATTGTVEFYTSIGRDTNFAFIKNVTLDVSLDAQGVLTIVGGDGDFSPGETHYGYLVLDQNGIVSVCPNYITVTSY